MTWMRRGDCSAVFSLEILRRILCAGEESAPREIGRGIQQISKQTDAAFRSCNTSAPRNGIFIQIPQGLARRGFKNQNPARGRKLYLIETKNGSRMLKISKPYPRKGTERISSLPCQSGGAVNVSQSHFADARVLGTFSHTTCYPISCAQGLASWTGQQGDRVSGGGGAMDARCKPS